MGKIYKPNSGRANSSSRREKVDFARAIFYDDAGSPSDVQSALDGVDSRVTSLEGGTPASGGSAGVIATATGVDMQAGGSLDYTVPVGKVLILTEVIVRNASADLAGGTDFDISDGVTPWNPSAITLAALSDDATFMRVTGQTNYAELPVYPAGSVLQLDANTGSTGAATATIDLIGYLVDA